MRTSSNPVFRNLPTTQGGYASFGSGTAHAGQAATQGYGQPYGQPQSYATGRSMTVDDVVTKTATTLGVLVVAAVISFVLGSNNPGLVVPLALGGALIGFALVMVATFGRKMNKGIVLAYAAFEGLFVGAISLVYAQLTSGPNIIIQAVIGTVGVFAGMLVVYKTGAIRVTPRLTRMVIGATIGVIVLMLVNLLASFFISGGLGLRDGGPLAIGFSLLVIALAAFNFLLDFDQADKMIRAGAPEQAAWAVALGLTVTLVWLYIEILRLLSYFNRN